MLQCTRRLPGIEPYECGYATRAARAGRIIAKRPQGACEAVHNAAVPRRAPLRPIYQMQAWLARSRGRPRRLATRPKTRGSASAVVSAARTTRAPRRDACAETCRTRGPHGGDTRAARRALGRRARA